LNFLSEFAFLDRLNLTKTSESLQRAKQYLTDIICARFVLSFCHRSTRHDDTEIYEVPTRKSFLYFCMLHARVGSVCTIRIPALCGGWWKHLRNDKGSDGWSDSQCDGDSHQRVAPH